MVQKGTPLFSSLATARSNAKRRTIVGTFVCANYELTTFVG